MENLEKKVLLNEFTAREIEELLQKPEEVTAIVSFGSLESHGWHCCLGPDYFVPTEVACRAARKLDKVVAVPCLPYGASDHYNDYPLSVSLRFETVIAVAEDVLESLIAHGITHIYILNGHDGNIPAIEIAARKVKARRREAKILFLPAWWDKVGPLMGDRFEVWNGLGHGGEGETSIMMATRPELVDLQYAEPQVPDKVIAMGEKANIIWNIAEVSKTGATGDPTKASIEKGNQMMEILVDLVVGAIEQMRRSGWKYS